MGEVARGEIADSLELPNDKVLAEGDTTSGGIRCWDGGTGGARDFPLPNILPPPSLRPDITVDFNVWTLSLTQGYSVVVRNVKQWRIKVAE
jgi:hypothetical protein